MGFIGCLKNIKLPDIFERVLKWASKLRLERWVLTINIKVKGETGYMSGWRGHGGSGGFLGIVFQAEGTMYDEAVIYLVLLGKGISWGWKISQVSDHAGLFQSY